MKGFEGESLCLAGQNLSDGGAASRTRYSVQIDGMRLRAVFSVMQADGDRVAHPHSQKRSRHSAVERPVSESDAVGHPAVELDGRQLQHNFLGTPVSDGGGHIRRVAGHPHSALPRWLTHL